MCSTFLFFTDLVSHPQNLLRRRYPAFRSGTRCDCQRLDQRHRCEVMTHSETCSHTRVSEALSNSLHRDSGAAVQRPSVEDIVQNCSIGILIAFDTSRLVVDCPRAIKLICSVMENTYDYYEFVTKTGSNTISSHQ